MIACFLVVFSHSCDAFVAVFDSDRATFLQGALAGSFVRACVPLFVMMSGVLLLPVRTGTGLSTASASAASSWRWSSGR